MPCNWLSVKDREQKPHHYLRSGGLELGNVHT